MLPLSLSLSTLPNHTDGPVLAAPFNLLPPLHTHWPAGWLACWQTNQLGWLAG